MNHGTTSSRAKFLDRALMLSGAAVDAHGALSLPTGAACLSVALLVACGATYACAKHAISTRRAGGGNAWHVSTHALATLLHAVTLVHAAN